MREQYFQYLTATSAVVGGLIKECFESQPVSDDVLHEAQMKLVKPRLTRPLQKPALLRLAYEACGGTDWQRVAPAACAFELLNISSYQANAAFDNKLGTVTRADKDSQIIAAMLTRELAFSMAGRLGGSFSEQIVGRVQEALSKSNSYIYLAQHYDLNLLTVSNFARYENEHVYLENYRARCFFGSGIINGQCCYAGALLAGAPGETADILRAFGEHFGTALQMVNDIGDFVPRGFDALVSRDFQDQHSDFRNGRLTMPLYFALKHGDAKATKLVHSVLSEKRFNEEALYNVTVTLVHLGAITYAQKQARQAIKEAKGALVKLPRNTATALLSTMTSLISTNKYHKALTQISTQRPPVSIIR